MVVLRVCGGRNGNFCGQGHSQVTVWVTTLKNDLKGAAFMPRFHTQGRDQRERRLLALQWRALEGIPICRPPLPSIGIPR